MNAVLTRHDQRVSVFVSSRSIVCLGSCRRVLYFLLSAVVWAVRGQRGHPGVEFCTRTFEALQLSLTVTIIKLINTMFPPHGVLPTHKILCQQ